MRVLHEFRGRDSHGARIIEDEGRRMLLYPTRLVKGHGCYINISELRPGPVGSMVFRNIDGKNEVRETLSGFDFRRKDDHSIYFSLTRDEYNSLIF